MTDASHFINNGEQYQRPLAGIRWRWGVIAALAMTLLSLWPQIYLVWQRGSEWNGSFAHSNYDEEAYAAYLNGLIEGRPRRSDPLVEPQNGELPPESLFSIQFTQPFVLATTARALGLSTSHVFMILVPVLAFLSTLAIFLLLAVLTKDERLASVGAVFVLCFGTIAASGGKILPVLHLGVTWSGLPFLRRYQPGFSFPLFFIFVLLVWFALTRNDRVGRLASVGSGLIFALLVFSYFFIWTAAAAWLVIIILVWLMANRSESWQILKRLAPLGVICGVTLILYAMLLAQIADTTSSAQVLEFTRKPDLFRVQAMIALFVIFLLWRAVKLGRATWTGPLTLITLSFALLPFLLFNQQVVTGLSLQPIHYQLYIGNYIVLLALFLAIFAFRGRAEAEGRPWQTRTLVIIGVVSLCLGLVELNYDSRKRREPNIKRDEFVAVAIEMQQEAVRRGIDIKDREVVFSPDTMVATETLANYAPHAPLWAIHTPFMPSLTEKQRKERFFLQLYYSGVDAEELGDRLRKKKWVEVGGLFGYERSLNILTSDFKPLTDDEIDEAVRQYEELISSVTWPKVSQPLLSWAVIPLDSDSDLANLDRWYLTESEEIIGKYRLLRIIPRGSAENEITPAQ